MDIFLLFTAEKDMKTRRFMKVSGNVLRTFSVTDEEVLNMPYNVERYINLPGIYKTKRYCFLGSQTRKHLH